MAGSYDASPYPRGGEAVVISIIIIILFHHVNKVALVLATSSCLFNCTFILLGCFETSWLEVTQQMQSGLKPNTAPCTSCVKWNLQKPSQLTGMHGSKSRVLRLL